MLALHNYQSRRLSQLTNPMCREGKQRPRLRPHNVLSCQSTEPSSHRVPGFPAELGLRTLDAGCLPARSLSSGAHSAQKVAAMTNLPGAGGDPPAAPTEGSGWSLALGRSGDRPPGQQCRPHSPATGDWCLGPQRPLACTQLCPGHWVGRSWGQAGTGRSQSRNLEEEYRGPVRTTGQNSGVGGVPWGQGSWPARKQEMLGRFHWGEG